MGSHFSIWYRRRDSRGNAHRDCLFISLNTDFTTAERLAKNLQDEFRNEIETAWVESE